jgi:hypothetical protein
MSPWLPRVTADQILRVLRRLGFEGVRSRASASTAPAFLNRTPTRPTATSRASLPANAA